MAQSVGAQAIIEEEFDALHADILENRRRDRRFFRDVVAEGLRERTAAFDEALDRHRLCFR